MKTVHLRVPVVAQWVKNLTSIPGLSLWVKDLASPQEWPPPQKKRTFPNVRNVNLHAIFRNKFMA